MFEKVKKILTKKTVYYIESFAYICSIIIVIMANVFGPIQIRMIPLLFVLGTIGAVVFKRPVVTTVFGTIVSLCVVYMSGVTNLLENIITSIIFSIYIALGELFGSKLKVVYKEYIKKRKSKNKEFTINLIICIALVVICTGCHNFTDSNIFSYEKCKYRLEEYLKENYSGEDFQITYSSYNFRGENSFRFNVLNNNDGNMYKFIVYLNDNLEIYDGVKTGIESRKIRELEKSFNSLITNDSEDIKKSITEKNDVYELNLEKKVENVNEQILLEYAKKVAEILDKVVESEDLVKIEQINLALIDRTDNTKSCISTIYLEGYKKNKEEGITKNYKYIMKALSIEYID